MNNMRNKTIFTLCVLFLWGLFGGTSCSNEELEVNPNPPAEQTEEKVQQLEIRIGGEPTGRDPFSRDLPPNIGSVATIKGKCSVNQIALMVFSRNVENNEEFRFDVDNSAEFDADGKIIGKTINDVLPDTGLNHTLKKAVGSFVKKKGYEYRVFALGYDTARNIVHPVDKPIIDERDWFRIKGADGNGINEKTTLSGVKLQLVKRPYSDLHEHFIDDRLINNINDRITGYWVQTPEIFYGEFRTVDTIDTQTDTITFANENKVQGIMYRGVARVTVNVVNLHEICDKHLIDRHVCIFSYMLDSLRTEVKLNSYDNFIFPDAPLLEPLSNKFGGNHTFTATCGESKCLKDSDTLHFSFFVLPTISRFGYRYTTNGPNHGARNLYNGYLAVPSISNGNQATGVIDPAASGKTFYFRRNQDYVIEGTGLALKNNDE